MQQSVSSRKQATSLGYRCHKKASSLQTKDKLKLIIYTCIYRKGAYRRIKGIGAAISFSVKACIGG